MLTGRMEQFIAKLKELEAAFDRS